MREIYLYLDSELACVPFMDSIADSAKVSVAVAPSRIRSHSDENVA